MVTTPQSTHNIGKTPVLYCVHGIFCRWTDYCQYHIGNLHSECWWTGKTTQFILIVLVIPPTTEKRGGDRNPHF